MCTTYPVTWGKSFCKTSFQLGMDLKKYRNKEEMKECKKTTLYMYIGKKNTVDIIVFLDSFISALVLPVLFQVHAS